MMLLDLIFGVIFGLTCLSIYWTLPESPPYHRKNFLKFLAMGTVIAVLVLWLGPP